MTVYACAAHVVLRRPGVCTTLPADHVAALTMPDLHGRLVTAVYHLCDAHSDVLNRMLTESEG